MVAPAVDGSDLFKVADRSISGWIPNLDRTLVVPIELKRFLDSGIGRVECPNYAYMRTLKLQGGVLQFKPHDKRKTRIPNTDQRWDRCETSWEVVGGEST